MNDEPKIFFENVLAQENKKRQEIKENLAAFHKAVDEREKIIDAAFNKKRDEEIKKLDMQSDELKKIIAAKDESEMLRFLQNMNAKS